MTRIDLRGLAGAVLAVVMLCLYVAVVRRQGEPPLAWYAGGLAIGAVLAAYGSFRAAPQRRPALFSAAALLGLLGFIGLLTIGFPIVIAAGLCLVAALAAERRAPVAP